MLPEASSSTEPLVSLAVLIPAWQPEPGFVALVKALAASGFGVVVIVDDGSSPICEPVFAVVAALPRVYLLRHAVNLGKGRALKSGFNFILTALPQMQGVVTADADGQHLIQDIVRVGVALLAAPAETFVLGARTLGAGVPWRNRFGNGLTRRLFASVTGTALADTQTGLRGFPQAMLRELMTLEGERYEYEMTVLAHLCRRRQPLEVAIETVYIEGNRTSHFDPLRDSLRIYSALANQLRWSSRR